MNASNVVRQVFVASVLTLSISLPANETKPDCNGCGQYVPEVPEFVIKDPLGTDIVSASLYNKTGMLLMLTVPNLTQYEKQKAWENYMEKHPWPTANAPQRVLLEDLSQQETFKNKVRGMMKEKYDPKGSVVVLVDEDGSVRRGFGVQQNETVILLVDNSGRIIHNEADEVEPDYEAAKRLIHQVRWLAQTQKPAESDAKGTPVAMAK